MSTQLAIIRAAIVAALDAIPNIGVVTDFEPYAQREEHFKTYFLDPLLGYVQGWTVTRAAAVETWASDRDNMVSHEFIVRGYRAINADAASERDFQDMLERVRDVMRANQRLQYGGVTRKVDPPQLRTVEARQFSDCLVHYAEIFQGCAELVKLVP